MGVTVERAARSFADEPFRPLPRPAEWVDHKPGSIWIYDTTHFTNTKDEVRRCCVVSRTVGWAKLEA